MAMLTRLILLLTLFAMLPFGSFSNRLAPALPVAAISRAPQEVKASVVSPDTGGKTFAAMLKRCKGQGLPGSPCNPALAVWPAALTLAFNPPATVLRPPVWPPQIGHSPAQPRDPPRLG